MKQKSWAKFAGLGLTLSYLRLFISGILIYLISTSGATGRTISRIKFLDHGSNQVGEYKALLIGINQYKDPQIPDLETAVSDVKGLAELLKRQYNFSTTVILNKKATKQYLYDSLRKLVVESKPDDSVLIYYAGHGEIDRLYDEGWWIPADAQAGNSLSYLDNVQVQKAMRGMKARHVLLISDSCYSGTLFGHGRAIPKNTITEKYYLELYSEKSRWGMTSGNKTPVSDSGTADHSVFAYQLIKTLTKNKSPYLSAQEIYTRIAPIITNNSDQTPMCQPIRNTGDQGGGFVFIQQLPAPQPIQAEKQSTLKVESNESKALVFINGSQKGSTNFVLEQLKPGDYNILVKKTGFSSYKKTVTLKPGRTLRLFAYLDTIQAQTGSLYVDTFPQNTGIQLKGISTKFSQGIELPPGIYKLHVFKKGYLDKKVSINIVSGEDTSIFIKLDKQAISQVSALHPSEQPVLHQTALGNADDADTSVRIFESSPSDLLKNDPALSGSHAANRLPRLLEQQYGNTPVVQQINQSNPIRRVVVNSTLEHILKSRQLTFGTTLNNPPFSFLDQGGNPAGIEIVLARKMAKDLGVKPVMVKIIPDRLVKGLVEKQYDIIMNGMVVTQKQNLKINFSNPYHITTQSLLVSKSLNSELTSLKDLRQSKFRIFILPHSKASLLLYQHLPSINFFTSTSAFEAANKVLNNEADMFIGNHEFCRLIYNKGQERLKIVDTPLSFDPIAWGIRKGDPDFLLWLNAFAGEVKNNTAIKSLMASQIEVCKNTIENEIKYATNN